MVKLDQYSNEKKGDEKWMLRACYIFQYFTIIYKNNFGFEVEKIHSIEFNDEALKSNQIPFQNFFRMNKIIKIDWATSIFMRGHLDILTDLLVNKQNSPF